MLDHKRIVVGGLDTQFLEGGEGLPIVFLHGDGDSADDCQFVMPKLAEGNRVIAPSFPGHGGTAPMPDYSPSSLVGFVFDFLEALQIQRAVVVGNSIGGLVALRLAMRHPERVCGLAVVGSSGLGRQVNPILAMESLPGAGELAIALTRTPFGPMQRAWARASLLFSRPWRAPCAWVAEQCRLAEKRGFLEASMAMKRGVLGITGQHQCALDDLPKIAVPTLVLWGVLDYVVPYTQGQPAVARLPHGHLTLIPDCGHAAQVERPEEFVGALRPFLDDHQFSGSAASSSPTGDEKRTAATRGRSSTAV